MPPDDQDDTNFGHTGGGASDENSSSTWNEGGSAASSSNWEPNYGAHSFSLGSQYAHESLTEDPEGEYEGQHDQGDEPGDGSGAEHQESGGTTAHDSYSLEPGGDGSHQGGHHAGDNSDADEPENIYDADG